MFYKLPFELIKIKKSKLEKKKFFSFLPFYVLEGQITLQLQSD